MSVDGIGLLWVVNIRMSTYKIAGGFWHRPRRTEIRDGWAWRFRDKKSLFKWHVTPARHRPRSMSPETRTKTYLPDAAAYLALGFLICHVFKLGFKTPDGPISVLLFVLLPSSFQFSVAVVCFRFLPIEHSSRASTIEAMFNNFLFFVQHFWRTLFPLGRVYCFGRECKVFLGDEKESWGWVILRGCWEGMAFGRHPQMTSLVISYINS